MTMQRTVRELSRLQGRVYVYLKDDRTGGAFLSAAEKEGFTFSDGAMPTHRHYSRVMAVSGDGTVSYVGSVGMAAFGANAPGLLSVDFAEYFKGSEDYFIKNL